jgi:hypothetical protein
MMMMEQLPFSEYNGTIAICEYTLPEELHAFDALGNNVEHSAFTVIPAHETVRLITSVNFGAIVWNGRIVGRI